MLLCMLGIFPAIAKSDGLNLSGGLDLRYSVESDPTEHEAAVDGVFLNLRKTWSDAVGDRWIGVAQVDLDDNFRELSPYQVYLQYKGPLGSWNVRAGHFLLPFGLLPTYDTERLLLQGLEEESLGIRKDTGAQVFGYLGDFDYSLSLTDGLGDKHFIDSRAAPVLTGRLAYVQDDWQLGFSTLLGRVFQDSEYSSLRDPVEEQRAALDLTMYRGPLTLRSELVGGWNDGQPVGGGVVLADWALAPNTEINSRYSVWSNRDEGKHSVGIGLTHKLKSWLFLRVADEYFFGEMGQNVLTAQIYMEFNRGL